MKITTKELHDPVERTYHIVNQHGAVVGNRNDFFTAVKWASDYLEGEWSIRTIVDGQCVIEREKSSCLKNLKLQLTETSRGFSLLEFEDSNGEKCSLQKSSIMNDDRIWLGTTAAKPQRFVRDKGWIPVEFPEDTLFTTRMHLNQEQVKRLLPILQNFVKTGELS